MFKITPQYLTDYINFDYTNPNWSYKTEDSLSMYKIQAEGASKIWNLLLEKKIALLADEVGMGKTIQALAVMTTLWRQKPNAKILLYAPNENVAKKWINEYENFIRYHYRKPDDLIKSSIDSTPLRNAIYCENHIELMEKISLKWPSLFVCKTSSLSGFMSPKITQNVIDDLGLRITKNVNESSSAEEQAVWMYNFAKKCNERIYRVFDSNGEPPFDLLIFDEAHYLRRSEGQSNRSIVAHAFYSGRNIWGKDPWSDFSPIAAMNLLLSATPNHSSSKDIINIISLFSPEYRHSSPDIILKNLCVRRYRRLAGKTKHEYRHEIPDPVNLSTLQEKLFFTTYQKSLVKFRYDQSKKDKSKNTNPYNILFGYLEGFEFLPQKNNRKIIRKNNDKLNRESNNGDFEERDDAEVIRELSIKFRSAYNQPPKHPKYEKIISDLSPGNQSETGLEKKIVYVRRIPSVYEITRRLIDAYDKEFYPLFDGILKRKQIRRLKSINLRSLFWQLAQKDKENSELNDDDSEIKNNTTDDELDDGIPNSRVFDLFTIKKEGKFKTTDCSNFRNRFLKKEQIFSIFFEPSVNYMDGKYTLKEILQHAGKRSYKTTIQRLRSANLRNSQVNKLTLEFSKDFEEYESVPTNIKSFDTLIGIWHRSQYSNSFVNDLCAKAKEKYSEFSILEKEGFSKYLEKGILFASPHVIYFYCYYKKLSKNSNLRGEGLYNDFCEKVNNNLEGSGLAKLIADAILTFQILYKKELGLTEDKLINEKWTFLNNTIPVYPFCGDTKRLSIIHAFNTPFYPNALIATSVLQEGVDLHYHCSEVIHYGIAWTQGDNEQRVGRVDRMFGKLENNLKTNPNTTLPIHFPYLEKTIDEDQIVRFIIRKHEAEQLIDLFKNIDTNNEINYRERIDESLWLSYFNKPTPNSEEVKEPYPVEASCFAEITCNKPVFSQESSFKKLLLPLFNTLKNYFGKEFIHFLKKGNTETSNIVCALKHIRKNGRHQPVIIELTYYEPGLSYIDKPTYILNIKTPMFKRGIYFDNLTTFGRLKDVYIQNPVLKICYDKKVKSLFKYYISTEIPLFIVNSTDVNISSEEIIFSINNLISFSDDLENKICNDDIKNEDVEVIKKGGQNWFQNIPVLSPDRKPIAIGNGWHKTDDRTYLFKKRNVDMIDNITAYIYNHENRFVRKIRDSEGATVEVGLYTNDALDVELNFLNHVLDNCNK